METMEKAPLRGGIPKSFAAPFDVVQPAVLRSLRRIGVQIKRRKETPEGEIIYIMKHTRGISWGEVGRVLVEKTGASSTKVYSRWERRMALQFVGSATRFAARLFEYIETELKECRGAVC
jgi:hypothetical protein